MIGALAAARGRRGPDRRDARTSRLGRRAQWLRAWQVVSEARKPKTKPLLSQPTAGPVLAA
jgi:hypothetical protein